MTRSAWVSAVALALLFQPNVADGRDLASQLAGVWKRTSFVQKELATGATTKPYGESPSGTAFFTLNGHFAWILVSGVGKDSAGRSITDAERAAMLSTASFGTGTHRVEGSVVLLKYSASSNPALMGDERRVEMQISGKTLTWTSPPYLSMDGKDLVAIQTLERME